MRLRERGIYRLPNGRELIVIGIDDERIRMQGWQGSELTEYELDPDGRLLTHGKLTAWDINHLTDTGRMASELSYRFQAEPEQSIHENHGP
jgi:hypothetical protein